MHSALHRSAALSLALAAMLLRVLLPDGWMPSANDSGTLFTICSVEPVRHDNKAPKSEGHTHVPCAFAAASTLAPPTFASLAFGISTPGYGVAADFADKYVVAAAPYCPNAARAPPVFA
jgi:hypothetical protein